MHDRVLVECSYCFRLYSISHGFEEVYKNGVDWLLFSYITSHCACCIYVHHLCKEQQ